MEKNNYRLKMLLKASHDLERIYSYIVNDLFAENAANNLIVQIEKSIMRLKDFPFSCNLVKDEILKNKGYRRLIIDNYVVFYIVDETDEVVVIMRILYGPRNYQNLIREPSQVSYK